MRAATTPDDVRLVWLSCGAIFEGCSSISIPSHLEHTGSTFDTFYAQAAPKLSASTQVSNKQRDDDPEGCLVTIAEVTVVL